MRDWIWTNSHARKYFEKFLENPSCNLANFHNVCKQIRTVANLKPNLSY